MLNGQLEENNPLHSLFIIDLIFAKKHYMHSICFSFLIMTKINVLKSPHLSRTDSKPIRKIIINFPLFKITKGDLIILVILIYHSNLTRFSKQFVVMEAGGVRSNQHKEEAISWMVAWKHKTFQLNQHFFRNHNLPLKYLLTLEKQSME